MLFSENWLKSWTTWDEGRDNLIEKLTMAGLEVEGVESVAPAFSGVIVGEVIDCQPHANADKLKVTMVSTGKESLQVVCGAPDVRVGMKVPFAMINATLPNEIAIREAVVRGEKSFGMLCSEKELGIDWSGHDGLMELPDDAPLGVDLREYLNLDDVTIDLSITPNRADCFSIAGIAREVSTAFGSAFTLPEVKEIKPETDRVFPASVKAIDACPRLVTRVIEHVNVSAKTPLWMKMCLERSGIRSLDPVVDVTNYVMLELGQPMHGYDLEALDSALVVRYAKKGECITLLDDSEQTLSEETLLIADREKPLGIAGVMGGKGSGIDGKTKHILLESAFFSPEKIVGKARQYGLHTEASHRFERGVDPRLQHRAMERATALILEICGGKPGPVNEVSCAQSLPQMRYVLLRKTGLTSLLGIEVDNSFIEKTLTNLGFELEAVNGKQGQWRVSVPGWRFDISHEEDLAEEVMRVYGYDRLPEVNLRKPLSNPEMTEVNAGKEKLRQVLVSKGYHEVINFSMIDDAGQKAFNPGYNTIVLQNPISSDMSVMRCSLLPGLLKTVSYNLRRQKARVRFFEEGQVFYREDAEKDIASVNYTSAVIYGECMPESWSARHKNPCDFFDIKGDLEALLQVGDSEKSSFGFAKAERVGMHPGQTASVIKDNKVVGYIGAIHPQVLKQYDIKGSVYAFEIETRALQKGTAIRYEPLSKYPEVRRDLAIIVNENVSCGQVTEIIYQNAGQWLKDVRLFDVYSGQNIEQGKKSFAFGLTWKHPSRTLKDNEINEQFDNLVKILENKAKATLRK